MVLGNVEGPASSYGSCMEVIDATSSHNALDSMSTSGSCKTCMKFFDATSYHDDLDSLTDGTYMDNVGALLLEGVSSGSSSSCCIALSGTVVGKCNLMIFIVDVSLAVLAIPSSMHNCHNDGMALSTDKDCFVLTHTLLCRVYFLFI